MALSRAAHAGIDGAARTCGSASPAVFEEVRDPRSLLTMAATETQTRDDRWQPMASAATPEMQATGSLDVRLRYVQRIDLQSRANRRRLVTLALTLSQALGACGGAGKDPAPAPPAPSPTPPTPSPAPIPSSLPGWQLTTADIGLTPHGLNCDVLPPYQGSAKPPAGTVIRQMRVTVPLDLSNGNILIEKSCIRPGAVGGHNSYLVTTTICNGSGCQATAGVGNVVIRDSEIDASALPAQTIAPSCAFLGVGTLERNYMHGMGSGICFFETGAVFSARGAELRARPSLLGGSGAERFAQRSRHRSRLSRRTRTQGGVPEQPAGMLRRQ
jgi:hypothetical protein